MCAPTEEDSPSNLIEASDQPLGLARVNLESDPASAYRWADMAESETNVNRVDRAKYCIRQALAAAPGSPAILFRSAKLYLRIEDYPETLQQLTKVLRNTDLQNYYDRAFEYYSAMDLPLSQLLDRALPKTPQAANAFLRFWVKQQKLDEAAQTWNWIVQNSLATLEGAGFYVSMLGKAGRWDQAMNVWSSFAPKSDPTYDETNWVYNGGFESRPVDSPFDWHLAPSDVAEVIRDTYTGFKGNASLFVRFVKTPGETTPLAYESVLLKPGRWHISAEMKTEELTSNQGLVIRVVDAQDPANLDVATATLTGTQEWTEVGTDFIVGDRTRLARVEVLRPPAQDLNIQFRGSAWIDDVKLSPKL